MSALSQNFIFTTVKSTFEQVNQDFQHFEPIAKISKKLNIPHSYLIIGFFLLSIIFLGSGIFSHLFVGVFGCIYPSYMTYKAISQNDAQARKQWLTYWIVFGFFTSFSRVLKFAIFFFISTRAFNIFRILLYIWMFHPRSLGAATLYNNYLKPKLVAFKLLTEEE